MFLALTIFCHLPVTVALGAAKLANTTSALSSLASYQAQGFVLWSFGLPLAIGMSIGSYTGAQLASRNAERIVRPVLLIVVALLCAKLFWPH
jgi:uncharacterized membrane protein YfcA